MQNGGQRQIFLEKILEPVVRDYRYDNEALSGFMAMEGSRYREGRKLMVIGRAVNSWGDGHTTATLQSDDEQKALIDGCFFRDGRCPMAWVTEDAGARDGYNTNSSAFWRVIRWVSRRLGVWQDGEEDRWSSNLVWSNLYKISPHGGGNPSNKLCELQEPGCIELLREEIREYAPDGVLFLTAMGWAWPFMKGLGCSLQARKGLAEAHGQVRTAQDTEPVPFVVAHHPQGKGEDAWVGDVLAAFQSLGVTKLS